MDYESMMLRRLRSKAGRQLRAFRSAAQTLAKGPPAPLEFLSSEYRAATPQRYNDNRDRYLQRADSVDTQQLLKGFVANNPQGRGDMSRFYFFCLAFDQILKEGLDGDVAELGVYKGNTATILAAIARRLGTTAWLLDTYEGFAQGDLEGVDANKRMEFADTSIEAVRTLVGEDNVRFVKGYFPDSASQIPDDRKYCLVHIDCDLYAPFRSALHYFYDRLVPGGFMLMHDYSSLHWDGAERAVDEFFADKPESVIPLPDSAGSVVVRKARAPDRQDNWFVARWNSGFAKVWIEARNGNISELLRSGWSGPEDWGVWGVGSSHELVVYLANPIPGLLELEIDCEAVLIGRRKMQEVEVRSEGKVLDVWTFTPERNRGTRSVRFPIPATVAEAELPGIVLEFRPRFTESPAELDSGLKDNRQLGLGVRRLRQRVIDTAAKGDAAVAVPSL
jgi:hypothetical protein